jgi:hypothetical protein
MTAESPKPLLPEKAPRDLRQEILDLVETDLHGPAGGPEEVLRLERTVRDRYLVGTLAPRGTRAEPIDDDEISIEESDETDEPADRASAQQSLLQSSIGLTFRVALSESLIDVTAAWGRYRREADTERESGTVWVREQVEGTVALDLEAASERGSVTLDAPEPFAPEVSLDAQVRREEEHWSVTVFLRNGQIPPEINSDQAWMFQVQLRVEGASGDPSLLGAPTRASDGDVELRALSFAYRHEFEFGVGHGVAVEAEVDEATQRAKRLVTRPLPVVELAQMLPPSASVDSSDPVMAELAKVELDMRVLAAAGDPELVECLQPLASAYRLWLGGQQDAVTAADLDDGDQRIALQVVRRGEDAANRIEHAINLIGADADAARAFRFAMQAMADQRVRGQFALHRRQGGENLLQDFDLPSNHSWRPFQLAFILLNLPALVDPTDKTRVGDDAIVDLLWFPTGGGKTEAYLGLTAFALAIRRLQPDLGGLNGRAGVAVIMRYTLRLLTLQQFQRAATLLCACELLREADSETWGDEPFRIGLWVGQRATPNRIDKARDAIESIRLDGYKSSSSPHQLPNCPWCGSEIDPKKNIEVPADEARVLTYCSDRTCAFSKRERDGKGLPVAVVDEELYRHPPSVLIATVDKFALLPWRGETQSLFGVVEKYCPRHGYSTPSTTPQCPSRHNAKGGLPAVSVVAVGRLRPPDLVIQDELHLISGPLGSLVGLYETAVDKLMEWPLDGVVVRAKVIASTATIRKARDQAGALYARELAVFPPPSIDARDSFFAREREISDDNPGRMYVGICAPGRRLKAILIRTYVALLAAAQTVYEENGDAVDPWMTLVGYFGAMRELAGMRRLCDDDVRTRVWDMDERGLKKRALFTQNVQELTSRLSASDIPILLQRMEQRFPDPGEPRNSHAALDVLLATNMISVGVDVERLGLMVAAGQPKSMSEYIQATSRVGRSKSGPGLVVTVYNWSRPRDLSHFERFFHVHRTAYLAVEPLTVTPFASRARDRGLGAVLTAMLRLQGTGWSGNDGAARMDRTNPEVNAAVDYLTKRAERVEGTQLAGDEVLHELERALDHWDAKITSGRAGAAALVYDADAGNHLLHALEAQDGVDQFAAPRSLRDVEANVALIFRLDDGEAT